MLILFSLALGAAGVAFDFGANTARAFWVGAEPGARALIGLAAIIVAIVAAHVLRLILARRPLKGERRDGVHSP
jgi:hypothetical protein